MAHDAELLHVPFAISDSVLHTALQKLITINSAFDAVLRVAVVRNKGGLFEGSDIEREADLIAFTADIKNWGDSVKLKYQPSARFAASPFAGTKITSWAHNLTWYEEAQQEGFDECILLNESGAVSECTSANIFIIRGNEVLTPPLDSSGCLPGVTRAILLEEIHLPGFEMSEAEITPSELEASDQVLITSTTRDLLAVESVDGFALHQDRRKLRLLQRAFAEFRTYYNTAHSGVRESTIV
jgi:branched-chain amino acid aminotransferase